MMPDHLHLSLLLIKLANIWLGRASHSFLPGGLCRMIIAAAMNLLLVGSLILWKACRPCRHDWALVSGRGGQGGNQPLFSEI